MKLERKRYTAQAVALGEQKTKAASAALAKQPGPALIAIIAALEAAGGPVRVRVDGYHAVHVDQAGRSFAERVQALSQASDSEVGMALAAAVAATLDMRPGANPTCVDALLAMLGQTYVNAARDAFKAEEYFQGSSTSVIKFALADMGEARAGGTKAELVALAATVAHETGWLPPELRAPSTVAVA